MSEIPIDHMVAELRRELGMRRSVYPRLVAQGKLPKGEDERRIAVMEEVLKRIKGEQSAITLLRQMIAAADELDVAGMSAVSARARAFLAEQAGQGRLL